MLMSPSGPRTTPGMRGRALSKRSSLFGALFNTFSLTESRLTDCADNGGAPSVPATDIFTDWVFNCTFLSVAPPAAMGATVEPIRPGAVASIEYTPGGTSERE